jgi:hypothetical protein
MRLIFSPTHISSILSILQHVFRVALRSSPTGRQPPDSSMPSTQAGPLQQISNTKLFPRPFHRGSRGPYFNIPDGRFRDPTKYEKLVRHSRNLSRRESVCVPAKQMKRSQSACRDKFSMDKPPTICANEKNRTESLDYRPTATLPHQKWIKPQDTPDQAQAIDAASIGLLESLQIGKIIRIVQSNTPQSQQPSRKWTSPQEILEPARARDCCGIDLENLC